MLPWRVCKVYPAESPEHARLVPDSLVGAVTGVIPRGICRAKRAKLEPAKASNAIASPVLHVRGLPDDSTEPELLALAQRFGPVSDVMLMIGKGQGFAQYITREAAALALQQAAATPGEIRCA